MQGVLRHSWLLALIVLLGAIAFSKRSGAGIGAGEVEGIGGTVNGQGPSDVAEEAKAPVS